MIPRSDAARRAPTWIALGDLMAVAGDWRRFAERSAAPMLDLVVRAWLAQAFFISGVLKIANWDVALTLAREEYPVAWLDPVTAAYVGTVIELVCPLLLLAGLATRMAAVPLLALSLVIQFEYQALDTHLFWAALFGWYTVRGANRISLDHLLSRGLADTALPGASAWRAFTRFLDGPGNALYLAALRLWLAGCIILAANNAESTHLPLTTATLLLPAGFWLAPLLITGLLTRATAFVLLTVAITATMTSIPEARYGLMALLALLAFSGPGALSLDALAGRALRRLFPQLEGKPAFTLAGLPRVVIVGAGFGGLACAANLRHTPVSITLIDRNNYHLFQPLLYQVATASLTPGDIAMPIRALFREQFNARVLMGEVTDVDTARHEVIVGTNRVPYDYLVLATGASHSYFGRDEWAPYAPGLKRIEDATDVRARVLLAFERAEAATDEAERRRLLTFLIVGGGPTGVELAGAIAELAHHGLEQEFRHVDPGQARILLVQSGPRLLPTFPEKLSQEAERALEKLDVETLTNSRVEHIDEAGVTVNGRRIESHTVLWGAGVVASPAARWLKTPADNAGRAKVEPDLSVPGLPNIFVIGDTAASLAWNGKPVPGLAPAAKQGGQYVARVIRARATARRSPGPFVYRHLGSLATIGRKAAVAEFQRLKLSGGIAWWLWGLIHVYFLVGVRNRVSVMLDWFWAYLTYRASTRLITGSAGRAPVGDAGLAPLPQKKIVMPPEPKVEKKMVPEIQET